MKERRKKLLIHLIELTHPVTIDYLANRFHVSEKTVRNDLKWLDNWLSSRSNCKILRRSGIGVILDASDGEREQLLEIVLQYAPSKQPAFVNKPSVRRLFIILDLLLKKRSPSVQEWATRFYVSKGTIHHDLTAIEEWLENNDLQLVKKPLSRYSIEGKEKNRRIIMAKILEQLNLFDDDRFAYDSLVVSQLLRSLEAKIGLQFTDDSLSRLTNHVVIAIKRCKIGQVISLPDQELQSLKKSDDYPVARQLAAEIERKLACTLPETEIAYMALHLRGAKMQYDSITGNLAEPAPKLDAESLQLAKDLIAKVQTFIHLPLASDQDLLTGLAIHLHAAVHRIKHGLRLYNPILAEIKRMYRFTFEALVFACNELENKIRFPIPEEEIGYLTLHFQAALERKKSNQKPPIKAILVCTTGIGTSQLLAAKIKHSFQDLELAATYPVSKLDQGIEIYHPDLLISTVPLENTAVPTICVTPLFNELDQEKLSSFIRKKKKPFTGEGPFPAFQSLLQSDLVFVNVEATSKNEIIQWLVNQLIKHGYVLPDYLDSTIRREELSSTYIGGGIATPHGQMDEICRSSVAIAHLKTPVPWGEHQVSFVIIPAIKWSDKEQAELLYKELVEIVDHPKLLTQLVFKKYQQSIQ
ncbi:MAG: BglG family transcription antiterminator [Thermoactinomyces sp.]